MTSTFTRIAGLAGLAGSLVLAALLVAPVLFPNTEAISAPFYGGGALLLAVFAAGLFRAGRGQTGIVAKIALAVAFAAFLTVAVVAVFDVFTRLGWGDYEWLWPVLVISAGLMFGGLAVYAAAATITRTIPRWAAIPLVIGGATFVALMIATIVMGDRRPDSVSQAINTAASASVALVTVSVGLLAMMLALGRIPGTGDVAVPAGPGRTLSRPST
jgi:hypothetical protein